MGACYRTLRGVTTGVVEEKPALWQACLAVMILSLMGALAALVIFYQDMSRQRGQQHVAHRTDSPIGDAFGCV